MITLAGVAFSAPAAAAETQQQNENQWRYVLHNGVWWYWLPANRWVYWRDNQWNDYHPQAEVNGSSASVTYRYATTTQGSQAGGGSDVGPFYGRALPGSYYSGASGSEIGPFYGQAFMGGFEGGSWSGSDNIGPFYGHAGY